MYEKDKWIHLVTLYLKERKNKSKSRLSLCDLRIVSETKLRTEAVAYLRTKGNKS